MKDDFDKEVLMAYLRGTVKKIEQYFNDLGIECRYDSVDATIVPIRTDLYRPEHVHKIFTEIGFTYVNNGCDGFCPECGQMLRCEVYNEMKYEWEWIYT